VLNLFGDDDSPPMLPDMGEAVLKAARMAVRKRLRGNCPPGMDREDLMQEVAIRTLKKCQRFRPGKKTLAEYAYVAACFALNDFYRDRAKVRDCEQDLLDMGNLLELEEARDVGAAPSNVCEDEDDELEHEARSQVQALWRASSAA